MGSVIEVEKIDHQLAVITHKLYMRVVPGDQFSDTARMTIMLNAVGKVVEKQYKYWV